MTSRRATTNAWTSSQCFRLASLKPAVALPDNVVFVEEEQVGDREGVVEEVAAFGGDHERDGRGARIHRFSDCAHSFSTETVSGKRATRSPTAWLQSVSQAAQLST